MVQAVVSGVGEVHPQRKTGRDAEALVLEAIGKALADAGLTPDAIDAVVTESSLTPQMAPFDRLAPAAGLTGVHTLLQTVPVGAGILSAVGTAFDLVRSGRAAHALVYFGLDWGTQPDGPSGYHEKMPAKKVVEAPAGFAGPPLYFAAAAHRYQYLHGLSDEQLQELLWQVVKSTRYNASAHPHAQQGVELSREQYLAKSLIAEPLRSVDCSLLSDGAVALVISAQSLQQGHAAPVTLAGWSYSYEPIADMDFYTQSPWLPDLPAARRASQAALLQADMTLENIDLFEIYDCFSIAVILQLEAIGLCEPGGGLQFCRNGRLQFDGATPVNTHGGLLAHGYLLGAGHVLEAIQQLRHSAGARQVHGARNAFVGAGPGRQYTALIFQRLEE